MSLEDCAAGLDSRQPGPPCQSRSKDTHPQDSEQYHLRQRQGLLAAKKGRLYRSWKRSQEAEAESTDDASGSQSECEMFDSDNVDDLDGSSSSSSSDSSQQEEEQLMKKGMRNRKRRTRRTRRRNSPVQRFANDRIQIQDHPGAP